MSDKISIRWKLFLFFFAFAALILVLLWVTQNLFFDDFYAGYKQSIVTHYSKLISENIDNPELGSLLVSVSQENELSIYILDESGTVKHISERSTRIRVNKTNPKTAEWLWSLVNENGGTYSAKLESPGIFSDDGTLIYYDPSDFSGRAPKDSSFNLMFRLDKIYSADGETYLVAITTALDPPTSVTNILSYMLIVTSFVSLVVAFFLSLRFSNGISKPIRNLSDSAVHFAEGNTDVEFKGGGCREITLLAESLTESSEKIKHTRALREELLANVSHDLRTPLTMIGGYCEMMRDIPGENNPENIQIIIDESKRLSKLVNGVLDLSKLRSGDYPLNPSVFCINDTISDLIKRFRKLSGENERLTFTDCEKTFVETDEVLVMEAIYNLVNNAFIHSGEDSEVHIRLENFGETVRISVIDNGCGIPESQLENIWERYQKGPSTGGGTGLGLAIVNASVKICGGTCSVASTPGKGSEFCIELKTCKAPE